MIALVLAVVLAQEKHPNMFVNQAEIDAIQAKVAAGAAPWKAAYDRMLSEANAALNQANLSVTYGGKAPSSGDNHDFWTEAPYAGTGDGIVNPDNDRTDYVAATALGKAVRSLGLGYAFTGQAKYADKALALVRVWCLDAGTKMNPKFTNGQSRIELCITMPGLFYGADLIWNYAGWSSAQRGAFVAWCKAFAQSGQGWSAGNNFENWRHVFLSTAAVVAEDPALRQYAFDSFKAVIPDQMAVDGRLLKETGRTKSLDYSTYALNAMTLTAEVARHFGVDLYGYRTGDGRGLEKSLDYHAPFVTNPSTWTYQQISAYTGANAALYEMAHLWKQKAPYLGAINKWGRPMTETRVAGPSTLTHAYGAYPWTLGGLSGGAPSPSPSPSPSLDRFQLIDMDTLSPILDPLSHGAVIDLSTLTAVNMNVFVIPAAGVATVRFGFDGNADHRTENAAPYALFGDGAGYAPWTPSLGQHTVTATPYSAASAGGTAGAPLAVTFTVIGASSAPAPAPPAAASGRDNPNGDAFLNDKLCGVLGLEFLPLLALLALRRRAGRASTP